MASSMNRATKKPKYQGGSRIKASGKKKPTTSKTPKKKTKKKRSY